MTEPGEAPEPGPGAEDIRRLVAGHVAADAREAAAKARFLAELDRLGRPCDETADPVHVTASAVVVGRRGTVLHRHRRLGLWLQPGGHIDPGERPEATAVRECLEETGLAATHPAGGPRLVHLDVHRGASGHTHLDLRFVLVGPDQDPAPPPGESPEVGWFTWAEAEAIADPGLVGALRAARACWEGSDGTGGGSGEGG